MSFRNRRSDFDHSFRRTRLMVNVIFGVVAIIFVAMIVIGALIGNEILQISDDPESVGNYVGEIVRGFNEAAQ